MKKKEFKTESKKLLDLMINSIYTNKEIAIRELISNASDAIDKLYFKSLTDDKIKINKKDLCINIVKDKDNRTITISDNGIGMTSEELDHNLGTIAESGSSLFKNENNSKDISIIGQFGVGFYSAFMIAKSVKVISKAYGSDEANKWESSGKDGYTITKCDKDNYGTDIILELKEDEDDYKYSDLLDDVRLREIIKKYSNYIKYPINYNNEVVNSMVPIWKKAKKDVKEEDYNQFYMSTFYDYDNPFEVIKTHAEGTIEYDALLFIPNKTPMDLYTKEYKKGLQLYSNGVLIMEHCEDLIKDHYAFIRGVVDTSDLPLNISRETLQENKVVDVIQKNLDKKITKELSDMLKNDRDKYEKFYENFGYALKMGIYQSYGLDKDLLQDLLLFYSSKEGHNITLSEYVNKMKEKQEDIYYAVGDTTLKIDLMPQVENMKDKGYEILYLTEGTDEFVLSMMGDYNGKKFKSVLSMDSKEETEEDKKLISEAEEKNKDLLNNLKESLDGLVKDVKFTNSINNHPVYLANSGAISAGMEKILNQLPTGEKVKAEEVLMINLNHKIVDKLVSIKDNKEELTKYAKILYSEARLIEGSSLENPSEIADLITELIAK